MKPFYLTACLLAMVACTEKIVSVPVKDYAYDSLKKYRLFTYYSLPKTVLKVQVPVVKSKLKPSIINLNNELIKLFETEDIFQH